MNRLEQLKEISDQALNGLRADEELKKRILEAAQSGDSGGEGGKVIPLRSSRAGKAIASLCALAAVMALVFVGLGSLRQNQSPPALKASTVAAGSHKDASPIGSDALPEETGSKERELTIPGLAGATVESIDVPGIGAVQGASACLDLIDLLRAGLSQEGSLPQDAETLVFHLSGGKTLEIPFQGDLIQVEDACWRCPAFFEALRTAAGS